ncbi:permease-like cell division protein FtsX [Chryseolinea sp. T2]|uniref:cell division protein FtsX n=1 Tax=Chryseolinea sp. T2 TaxID=3129255 RepID=UPI003077CA1B
MEHSRGPKKLGGYPAVAVVISITLSLVVMGVLGVLLLYSGALEQRIRKDVRIQVYLKSNLTETQRLQIENKLLSQDYVSKDPGSVTFVSKEDAAKKLIQETGEDFEKLLGDNPLKEAYLVTISPDFHTVAKIGKIKEEIQAMNGVFQVYYVEDVIEDINTNVTTISIILLAMIFILLITVVLLINSTLRLAMFSQRALIRSMQLVGAKNWFILRPFLARACGYGVLAGLAAGGLLYGLSQYAQREFHDLSLLHNQEHFLRLLAALLIIGTVVAVISTLFSVRRYLRMSLEQLY